ncbi:NAD(P)/FAD-dependent oxidoreductase [Plesiomonas sp.]|uniref:NAD(P)/FAD-dependent oxidoreductase n=1 Tax=Plesiomonas sp. TaxID=2486279 RepID=UPI003F3826B8
MENTIVIVGGGHAGFQLASSLRRDGYQGKIVIFEKQADYPYQRPPLSKGFLLDKVGQERLLFRTPEFYSSNAITFHFTTVDFIDRQKKLVVYDDGKTLSYDALVLAVGVSPKQLMDSESKYSNVYSIASLLPTIKLKETLKFAENIIVVGSGFIGLEFASVAVELGKNVHVISSSERVMRRSISSPLAAIIKEQHTIEGVNFHESDCIVEWITKGNHVTSVKLSSGKELLADLIIIGVGSTPNIQLAVAADLPTADGIIVDERLCTVDPSIYAIGDCALFPYADQGLIRLESVQNAVDQARYLSKQIVDQHQTHYHFLPWFWSDQGNMKIQVAGIQPDLSRGLETVTLGDNVESGYVCFCFVAETLAVVETINRPSVHMMARKVLSGDKLPTYTELFNVDFDLSRWCSTVKSF